MSKYSVNFAVTRHGTAEIEADSIKEAILRFIERGDAANDFLSNRSDRVVKVTSVDDPAVSVRYHSDGKTESLNE